jgi:hypothetical protein
MSASVTSSPPTPSLDQLQAGFLAIRARIERHAAISCRHVRCANRRADFIAEATALAWKWYAELARKGKDAAAFASVLAGFACRAIRCGRRVAGQESASDVLSERAQRRHAFTVSPLPCSVRNSHEQLYGDVTRQRQQDAFEERLQYNRASPVAEQVQFKLDFAGWLKTRTSRERRIIRAMLRDERTTDLSQRFHLSPGRISQLRREFKQDWERFCGDGEPAAGVVVA